MKPRSRFGALGLRGRIVGLVVFTTVATLIVAAVALLGPLESHLKNADLLTLQGELKPSAKHPAEPFKNIDLAALGINPKAQQELFAAENQLAGRVDGYAYVFGFPSVTGQGTPQAPLPVASQTLARDDPQNDVEKEFITGAPNGISGFGTIDGQQYAEFAIRFETPATTTATGHPQGQLLWVLAVRKRLDDVTAAVSAVRKAFLTAALAGLGLSLIVGIALSGTLVRRLRRLRVAALRLAREGPVGGRYVPVDRARDEVGDLARTFATMQRQLQHQEEARRAFVATASHELRTPLASLDGMLELLDDDLGDAGPALAEARALLDRARAQSRRLARLAGDLLDLSRLDAEVALRTEPVELGELSRAVLAEFELGTAERQVSSKLEIADGQVWALGDPGSIARIVRILLDNALRVSPEGSEIKVELSGGAGAQLSVSDEGPGIAAEDRAIIFERFQRGRDTGGEAGFGLGLAIGRELAERMHGELDLDQSYESGARFILQLPIAPAHEIRELSLH